VDDLGPIELTRRRGDEPFHYQGDSLGFDLLSFWQWSSSDVVSNATRGVIAEYLVACALGVAASGLREEWAAYDVQAPDGTRIEVKSSAYIQSWRQDRFSQIVFTCPKTLGWDRETNQQSGDARRQADVYVFALLDHKDQATLDPLDVSQWKFFVLPTASLDSRQRSQHSITLPSLLALCGRSVGYSELRRAIEDAASRQKGTG
jgi:hypothetical protein